jgi:putative sigma-54 modulation protein
VQLQVKGRNLEVDPEIRAYVEEKLSRLDRHLHELARIEVELHVERNPSISDAQVAEATVWSKGPMLRARESSPDMRASIDLLLEKLMRQAERARGKRTTARRRHPAEPGLTAEEALASIAAAEDRGVPEPVIVKTKRFAVKPMSPEEAALQLELISHDFFVFRNAESGDVNVVYRRRDGQLGLIEPDGA